MSISRWLDRLLLILFHFLLLTTPFIFTWVNDELFEFNKMLWVYGLGVSILGLWLVKMLVEKRNLIKRTPFDWVIGAFVISQLISTLLSIHPRTSWLGYYTRFHGGFLSTLTYVGLYYAAVSTITKQQVLSIVVTILVATVGVAAYSLPEHWDYSPSCWLISGGQNFDTSCWSDSNNPRDRIFGTFGQPNWLAAYVLMSIPLSIGVVAIAKRRPLTVLSASAMVAALLTLLFTKSRSGFLGLIVSLAVYAGGLLLAASHSNWEKTVAWLPRPSWLAIGICFSFIVISTALIGTPFSPSLLNLTRTSPAATATPTSGDRLESGGTDSGEIRKIVWEGAWNVGRRYPWFGSGVETFAYSYYLDRPLAHNQVSEWNFLYNKAHNEFLNFWATSGAVGLLTYVALLGWFGVWVIIQLRSEHSSEVKVQLISFLTAVIGLMISNFFGFSTVTVTLLWFMLMALAVVLTHHSTTESPVTVSATSNWWQMASWAGIAGLMVYGLMRVGTWWLADVYFTQGQRAVEAGNALQASDDFQRALLLSPDEALFHDELASLYANAAVSTAQNGDLEEAEKLATASLAASDTALALNPRHLNFYKTRVRIFIVLGQLNPEFLQEALQTLKLAITLAPTDPQLLYNQALVENTLGQTQTAQTHLEETLQMKPDYHSARFELAKLYEETKQLPAALSQYQQLHTVAPNDPTITARLKTVEASISAQQKK